MRARPVFRRDEFLSSSLDLGSMSLDLADYATTGLRVVAVGPSGIGKTNAGLLIAEQLAAQGWQAVLLDPEGEIAALYETVLTAPDALERHLVERSGPPIVVVPVLARLAGRLSLPEIAGLLTERLRRLTGDAVAGRSRVAVQDAISHLGLHASEPIGGLSTAQAGRAIGSLALVQQALAQGRLRAFRVGTRYVIPWRAFEAWRTTRDAPPPGWVRLTSVRAPLGIRSDAKLPEYAKLGYIPGAVFVQSSHLWFVAPEVARRLVDDAHAGRPLPWHGRPLPTNTRATWRKWQARKHRRCPGCRRAWGPGGPPRTFGAFTHRYPALAFGAKRHLTWRPGRGQAARRLGKPIAWVRAQIRDGVVRPLRSADSGAPLRLSRIALRRLAAVRAKDRRGRPPGVWLGVHAAALHAGVSIGTVQTWGRRRLVGMKPGRRGRLYSLPTLERQARAYWRTVRFKRAAAPAWLAREREAA